MSAPASEELRELERGLVNAGDSGQTVGLNALREEFPDWSREELLEALGTLREHGLAVEEAPGEWRAPSAGEQASAAEPPRVAVRVEDEPAEGAMPSSVVFGGRAMPSSAIVAGAGRGPNVRLTRSIANALDGDALGKIIKAAIESLEEDEVFTLEVTP